MDADRSQEGALIRLDEEHVVTAGHTVDVHRATCRAAGDVNDVVVAVAVLQDDRLHACERDGGHVRHPIPVGSRQLVRLKRVDLPASRALIVEGDLVQATLSIKGERAANVPERVDRAEGSVAAADLDGVVAGAGVDEHRGGRR